MATSNALGNALQIFTTNSVGNPSQPAFLAILESNVTSATGNGAVYPLGSTVSFTEIFDHQSNFNVNGTFTAPRTGHYALSGAIRVTNCTLASLIVISMITTKRTYTVSSGRTAVGQNIGLPFHVLANMDTNDTATISVMTDGELSNSNTISGSNNSTFFCGHLVC